MPQINLLPWRETLRQNRQRQFIQQTFLIIFLTLLAIMAYGQVIEYRIDRQNKKNHLIQTETHKLDLRVQEVTQLRQRRNQLSKKIRVMQNLQRHRSNLVLTLNSIAHATERQFYLTLLKQEGDTLTLEGEAEDNHQISYLVRHLAQSEVLEKPALKNVGNSNLNKGTHRFTIQVRQKKPTPATQHEKRRHLK